MCDAAGCSARLALAALTCVDHLCGRMDVPETLLQLSLVASLRMAAAAHGMVPPSAQDLRCARSPRLASAHLAARLPPRCLPLPLTVAVPPRASALA